jgi:orotate phosphoribosyltransferase
MANLEGKILESLKHDRLVREGHVAYSSGRHSGALLDPDHLTTNPVAVGHMSYAIAKHFFTDHIQTVASPSLQGAALAMWVGHFLDPVARVVPAEMTPEGPAAPPRLDDLIVGRRVLLIDDLIVSGDLIRPLLHSVEARGGEVIGIAALWNVGEPEIEGHAVFGLLNTVYDVWPQAACPLCAAGDTPGDAGY